MRHRTEHSAKMVKTIPPNHHFPEGRGEGGEGGEGGEWGSESGCGSCCERRGAHGDVDADNYVDCLDSRQIHRHIVTGKSLEKLAFKTDKSDFEANFTVDARARVGEPSTCCTARGAGGDIRRNGGGQGGGAIMGRMRLTCARRG